MARVSQRVNYYNFSGGKVSDTNPLTPPENAVRRLMNVDLKKDGSISRRLGLEPEPGFMFPFDLEHVSTDPLQPSAGIQAGITLQDIESTRVDLNIWTQVDFNPDLNFVVVRVNDTLRFYLPNTDNISNNLIHEMDITSYKTDPAAPFNHDSFQTSSGKGLLVCTGNYYTPFYVKYDSNTETWTSSPIDIRIRDFEGVDDGYEVNERPVALDYNNHNTITAKHLYNLLNQGWGRWEIDDFHYQTGRYGGYGVYPANSDVAAIGRGVDGSSTSFHANRLTASPVSTGRAPSGHFIINPFDTTTRGTAASSESGVGLLNVGGEITTSRPQAVAFFAGRFFYASVNGLIFYSQIIEGEDDLGKCYQENDPTVTDLNALLDTDGGTLKVFGVGQVQHLAVMGNSLVVFGSAGIYTISGGTDKGFTANNQQVGFLSELLVVGYRSVIRTSSAVVFWSERGVFAVAGNELGDPQVIPLSDNRVSRDYFNIPPQGKASARGCFNPQENTVYWWYNDGQDDAISHLPHTYNAAVVLDMNTGGFRDYALPLSETSTPPMLLGCTVLPVIRRSTGAVTVTDELEEPVLDEAGEIVYTVSAGLGTSNIQNVLLLYLPDADEEYRYTFGRLTSRTFFDWTRLDQESIETTNNNSSWSDWPTIDLDAISYSSEVTSLPATLGEPSVKKQSPYVYVYSQERGSTEGYPVYDVDYEGSTVGPVPPGTLIPATFMVLSNGVYGLFGSGMDVLTHVAGDSRDIAVLTIPYMPSPPPDPGDPPLLSGLRFFVLGTNVEGINYIDTYTGRWPPYNKVGRDLLPEIPESITGAVGDRVGNHALVWTTSATYLLRYHDLSVVLLKDYGVYPGPNAVEFSGTNHVVWSGGNFGQYQSYNIYDIDTDTYTTGLPTQTGAFPPACSVNRFTNCMLMSGDAYSRGVLIDLDTGDSLGVAPSGLLLNNFRSFSPVSSYLVSFSANTMRVVAATTKGFSGWSFVRDITVPYPPAAQGVLRWTRSGGAVIYAAGGNIIRVSLDGAVTVFDDPHPPLSSAQRALSTT